MKNEFENNLLSRREYDDHDLKRTFEEVEKKLNTYKRLKYKCSLSFPIKITRDFEIEPVDKTISNSYSAIDDYIDSTREFYEIHEKISKISKQMTPEERVYLVMYLLNNQSKNQTLSRIGCSKNGIELIQNSCMIKIAWIFNIEVLKGSEVSEYEKKRLQFS